MKDPAKCELVKPEVDYVGNHRKEEDLKISAGIIKAIRDMKDRKTEGNLRQYLLC